MPIEPRSPCESASTRRVSGRCRKRSAAGRGASKSVVTGRKCLRASRRAAGSKWRRGALASTRARAVRRNNLLFARGDALATRCRPARNISASCRSGARHRWRSARRAQAHRPLAWPFGGRRAASRPSTAKACCRPKRASAPAAATRPAGRAVRGRALPRFDRPANNKQYMLSTGQRGASIMPRNSGMLSLLRDSRHRAGTAACASQLGGRPCVWYLPGNVPMPIINTGLWRCALGGGKPSIRESGLGPSWCAAVISTVSRRAPVNQAPGRLSRAARAPPT